MPPGCDSGDKTPTARAVVAGAFDILLRANAEESRAVGISGLTVPPSIQSVRIRRDAHGLKWVGTAGSAKPPVLLSSVMFGLPVLFVPQGVRQTSTDSELLL